MSEPFSFYSCQKHSALINEASPFKKNLRYRNCSSSSKIPTSTNGFDLAKVSAKVIKNLTQKTTNLIKTYLKEHESYQKYCTIIVEKPDIVTPKISIILVLRMPIIINKDGVEPPFFFKQTFYVSCNVSSESLVSREEDQKQQLVTNINTKLKYTDKQVKHFFEHIKKDESKFSNQYSGNYFDNLTKYIDDYFESLTQDNTFALHNHQDTSSHQSSEEHFIIVPFFPSLLDSLKKRIKIISNSVSPQHTEFQNLITKYEELKAEYEKIKIVTDLYTQEQQDDIEEKFKACQTALDELQNKIAKETDVTSRQPEDQSKTQQGENVNNQSNNPKNEIDEFKNGFNQLEKELRNTDIKTNTDSLKKLKLTLTQLKNDYDGICGNQNQEDLSEYSEKLEKMSELISGLQERQTLLDTLILLYKKETDQQKKQYLDELIKKILI